jgi:hypothetical protein
MATLDETRAGLSSENRAPFFSVSLAKFTAMSVCTFGVYEIYWFYKNWRLVRERENLKILPFWRAFFAFFFCYQCFSRIRAQAATIGIDHSVPAGPLAAAWIITSLLYKLPDPFWLVSLLAFLFILPIQALANRINETMAPGHDQNRRLTGWNIAAVAGGGIFFVLAIIGSFVLDA